MKLLEMMQGYLSPHDAEQVKMFGGVCFMVNGNMVAGTSKRGLLVRIGKEGDAQAAKRKEASPMIMRDKPMPGYWYVDASEAGKPEIFEHWMKAALAHNANLPAKERKGK